MNVLVKVVSQVSVVLKPFHDPWDYLGRTRRILPSLLSVMR